ncbi:MAG: TMEM165/GDT1 family protein [Desulfurococcales archaeon]|nr:TMEM165/GDT1 family protein [Desulfurococcales archaeon]
MIDFSGYLMSVAAVLASEVGDRTMLATTAFAAARGEFVKTVAVSVAAFTLANIPVVLGGTLVSRFLNIAYLQVISAILFIGVGAAILISKTESGINRTNTSLTLFFTAILLSELGDKSQLALLSLTFMYGYVPALAGAVTAYSVVNAASAALMNKLISRYLSARKALTLVKYVSAIFFLAAGTSLLLITTVI